MRVAAAALRAAGVEAPHREAELLLRAVCQISAERRLREPDLSLSPAQLADYRAAVAARAARMPFSRILGCREFYSLDFTVTPAVLDPRPDTETLIDALLEVCPDRSAPLRLLDLCTGSGCIALTFLHLYPNARAVGTDISEAALQIAQQNARRLQCSERFQAVCADGTAGLRGPFDVVVSNPPYIPSADIDNLAPEVRCFDPHSALDGGADGLRFYRAFAAQVPALCGPGAYFLLECGEGQSATVIELLTLNGFLNAQVRCDAAGIERCVTGQAQDPA